MVIPGTPTTPEQAALLLSRFRDEKTGVLCALRTFGVNLLLSGKVEIVEDGEVEIVSSDGLSGIRLSLRADGLEFAYREPREFPELAKDLSDEERTAMSLVIKFPDRGLMSVPEFAMVIEAIRGRNG